MLKKLFHIIVTITNTRLMPPKKKISQSPLKKAFLIGVGGIAVGLGAIGLVLPGIPTTPFLLLALWAFSSSSRRFRIWLLRHRWFAPLIRNWQRERVIPIQAKIIATVSMATSWLLLWWTQSLAIWLLALIALFFSAILLFLFSKPSKLGAKGARRQ